MQTRLFDKRDVTNAYSHSNEFSYQASKSVNKAKYRTLVLNYIKDQGLRGATSDEAENALGLSHQLISPRFTELKALDLIKLVGKRKTRSGRAAGVWCVRG